MASLAHANMEHSKWEAFKLVKTDNVDALRRCLEPFPVDEWRHWRNFGGKTLLQLAEWESTRDTGGGTDCLGYLRGRLGEGGQVSPPRPAASPPQHRASPPRSAGIIVSDYSVQGRAAPSAQTIMEPMAGVPTYTMPMEPIAGRPPPPVEPVARPPPAGPFVVPVEPVIPPRSPDVAIPTVVNPHVVEKTLEIPQRQETTMVVEVPEKHHLMITKEIPRVNIQEETHVREVPVHHKEEILRVHTEPQVEFRNVTVPTVREKIMPVVQPVTYTEEERVAEKWDVPTVDTIRTIIRPETEINPVIVKGAPEIKTTEQTLEYDFPVTVQREEVVLKPEVEKVEVSKVVHSRHERIREVPTAEQVVVREVTVPEVTTIRKVKYVPTFETETSWRPAEPMGVLAEPVAEPVAGREPWRRMTFSELDRNGDGVISREEWRQAMEGRVSPLGAPDADALGEELERELRQLRDENRQLEDAGLRMQAELRQYQAEADGLVEELSRERRAKRELAVRMQMHPTSPTQALPTFTVSPLERSPGVGVSADVRRAMGELYRETAP